MDQVRTESLCLRPLLVLLALVAAGPGAFLQAQNPATATQARAREIRKATSYAFVSPNTRENLTLKEAIESLRSLDERRLIEETRTVACRLRLPLHVRKAVGSWTDGAEHSTLIRAGMTEASVRYAASWLGKFARQKAILYFRQSSSGAARMYILFLPRPRQDLRAITTEFDSDGVANRTLVPLKKRVLVYIVDLKDELKEKVSTAARRLHARLSSIKGQGEFIGDDDRDKAQAVFEQEILNYEVSHPRVRRACRKTTVHTTSSRFRSQSPLDSLCSSWCL
jgi:hypothetical protein